MATILLIDDAKISRDLLRYILQESGYTICGEASNGKDGVAKYKQLKPDLVFCDLMMDEMGGEECLKQILEIDSHANVVICSAAGDKFHVGDAIGGGAKEYIIKPIKAQEVIEITEKLIGKPTGERTLKQSMEIQAMAAGIGNKQVLDFFEAFQVISGIEIDDPKVNREYLMQSGEQIIIGIRALVSSKMSIDEANQLTEIFRGFYLGTVTR